MYVSNCSGTGMLQAKKGSTYLVVPGSEVLHLHYGHSYAHQCHCGDSLLVLSQCWYRLGHLEELDQSPDQRQQRKVLGHL